MLRSIVVPSVFLLALANVGPAVAASAWSPPGTLTPRPSGLTCTFTADVSAATGQPESQGVVSIVNSGQPLPAGAEILVTSDSIEFPQGGNAGMHAPSTVLKTEAPFPSPGYEHMDTSAYAQKPEAACKAQIVTGVAGGVAVTAAGDTTNNGATYSVSDLANAVAALTARVAKLEAEVAAMQK